MRIGIDCTKCDLTKAGGINTYIKGLLNGFFSAKTTNSFVIFCSAENADYFERFITIGNVTVLTLPGKRNNLAIAFLNRLNYIFLKNYNLWAYFMDSYYSTRKKIIEDACDILYCPNTLLMIHNLSIPTLLSLHDIQHVHFPFFFKPGEVKYRLISYMASAYKATYIQASSEFIKKDFLNYFKKLKKEQIVTIPEGVDLETFRNRNNLVNVRLKFNLPEKFLFYPAQLWKHKNHLNLLKAINYLRQQKNITIPLVLCGRQYSSTDEVTSYIKENNLDFVRYLGAVDNDELVALFHSAYYLVMPSVSESSSLPILEAAASGLPIIASNIGPVKEMNQNLKMSLFDPNDVSAIAKAIGSVWVDHENRENEISHNLKAVTNYAWEKIADSYLEFMEQKMPGNRL